MSSSSNHPSYVQALETQLTKIVATVEGRMSSVDHNQRFKAVLNDAYVKARQDLHSRLSSM